MNYQIGELYRVISHLGPFTLDLVLSLNTMRETYGNRHGDLTLDRYNKHNTVKLISSIFVDYVK